MMFFAQEFSSLVCMILQFMILYYLIKIYIALEPSENHQQPITVARSNRGNERRMNDIAGRRIRYATENDEREDWVSVFSS